jgi:hypothetical protein
MMPEDMGTIPFRVIMCAVIYEQLNVPAVSALSVRSRKRSTVRKVSHRMGDQNLLSRAPPCFGNVCTVRVRNPRPFDQ